MILLIADAFHKQVLCKKYLFMKSVLSKIAYILLLFNGFGALYGGVRLITQPDGSSLGLPLSLLANSPFHDFLIPGILLLLSNGVASIGASISFTLKPRKLAWVIWAQGVILLIWLIVQVIMIKTLHPLQFILGAVGVALIWLGREIASKQTP
ncbi:hypothetical protein [Emticicia agri]|uniref:Uncharacterized protein n=1 Tax=Emticicia agri TaxID=2492393 RepID=A0A4Q5LZM6_9BACT|nr:hypothetical protein [Emticicia agri]RYU95446.1 hypothetical protein EWM59_12325 [Emticicia agri]